MKATLTSVIALLFVLFSADAVAGGEETCATTSSSTSTQYINSTITLKILLVDFSDVPHRTSPSAYTKQDFEDMLGSLGTYVTPATTPDGEAVYGSMEDYFNKMSSGNVTINAYVVNNVDEINLPIWVRMQQTKAYYYQQFGCVFANDAYNLAQSQGLDVATPNDFTFVAIVYAGNTYFQREVSEDNWIASSLNPRACSRRYIMSERQDPPHNQENPGDKFSRIGIHCHEFAHLLGIGHSSGSRADLMQAGTRNGPGNRGAAPAPLNPMHRINKGWAASIAVTGQQEYQLYYDLINPQIRRVNSNANGDYFLFENRRFDQNMMIGSTSVPDYNNDDFFPPAWPHGTITQGIFVWRSLVGQISDYPNNGLLYASGNWGAHCPEGTPSETDDGVPFPGNCNVTVLSPWSDSRLPSPLTPPTSGIFVPNTKTGSNVGMEVLEVNNTQGYIRIKLYATNPQDASPSKPKNLAAGRVKVGGVFYPKLTWSANSDPDIASYKIYRWIDIDPPGYVLKGTVSHPTTTWTDMSVFWGTLATAYYYITAVDGVSLESSPSNTASIGVNYASKPIFADELESGEIQIPSSFTLEQNQPNPFNPTTTIKYGIPVDAHITMKVYNVLGKEIVDLVDEFVSAGYHELFLDASSLASGVYFYRINAGPFTDVKKLVLLK